MPTQHYTTGAKKDKFDRRDHRIKGILAPVEIPKQQFVIDDPYQAKNQDGLGSCTSQSQAHHKERQEKVRLSARFIMSLSKQIEGNTSYGGYARNTFKAVNQTGICEDSLYPEPQPNSMTWEEYINVNNIPAEAYKNAENHKSKSYWRVENDIDEIRNTLVTYKNSVNMSMAWHKEFNQPEMPSGRLPLYTTTKYEGHEVDIKGFDDFEGVLICKNSWSSAWGVNGDFKLRYDMFDGLVWDLWCSLDYPSEMPVDNYYGGQRTWVGYLREKAVVLNAWLIGKIGRLPTRREIIGLAYGFYEWEAIFKGKYGDIWLKMTKPEARKQGLIN